MAPRMTRRYFLQAASVIGLGLGGATLVGCAPKAAPTVAPVAPAEPKPATPTEEPKPAAKEPVTLILHMRAGGEQSEAPIYVQRPAEFMEEHPNIKIELGPIPGGEYEVKIQTMAAAGTIGDAMFANCYLAFPRRLIHQGVLATVDEYLDVYGISKEEWIPSAVEGLSYEGRMYGFPKGAHPGEVFLFVNEGMFQDAGLDVPEMYGHTPEDVIEWAEKLTKGPESDREIFGYFFGVSHFHAFSTPLRSFGGYKNNPEGTESLIGSPEWYEWAQYTNAFFRRNLTPHAEALPSGGSVGLFTAQRLPLMRAARSTWSQVKAAADAAGNPFEWRCVQLPRKSTAAGWPSNADVHAATANTKHPEEAFQFMYALADKRFAELVIDGIGYLTARLDDDQTLDAMEFPPKQRDFLDLQYTSQVQSEALRLPANTRGSEVGSTYVNEFQSIWLGDKELTPAIMNEIKAKVDEILARPM